MNLRNIFREVKDLAEETGSYIEENLPGKSDLIIEAKGLHDYVTHVDRSSEEKLIRGLKKILPGSGIMAEESFDQTTYKSQELVWVVDPLDGTTNFIHGLPPYCISIALTQEEHTILGLVYDIPTRDIFYSWKGEAAYRNDEPISVSKVDKFEEALLATGFPYRDFDKLDAYMDSFSFFMKNTQGIRRLGSAALDLAYVACGRFDAFWEYSLSPWDVAAGSFLVEQAGGRVADFNGGNDYIKKREIIATNAQFYETFVAAVKRFFNNG